MCSTALHYQPLHGTRTLTQWIIEWLAMKLVMPIITEGGAGTYDLPVSTKDSPVFKDSNIRTTASELTSKR
jgi:hypothetical protein